MIELIGLFLFLTTYLLFILFGASKEDKKTLREEFSYVKKKKIIPLFFLAPMNTFKGV